MRIKYYTEFRTILMRTLKYKQMNMQKQKNTNGGLIYTRGNLIGMFGSQINTQDGLFLNFYINQRDQLNNK